MKRFLLVIGIITFILSINLKAIAQTDQTVNNGAFTTAINFLPAGCTYNWVNDNPLIGLPALGTGNILPFKALNPGSNPITATIKATATTGCVPIVIKITVNPTLPLITASPASITLNTVYGTVSVPVNFTVTGKNLKSGIELMSPNGFEISKDGAIYTDKVTLNDDNADLSYIYLDPDVIRIPAIANSTTDFTATANNSVATIIVTPTAASAAAKIKINGVDQQNGSASAPIALIPGQNAISITVIAQNGSTTKNYNLNITRLGSSDATLANLAINPGSISPLFSPLTTAYSTIVYNGVISITPTATNSGATVNVNGAVVASGSASGDISLQNGTNMVPITVTAQDGVTSQTYNLTVVNTKSANAGLAQLSLSMNTPIFRITGTTNYFATVGSATTTIQQTAVASDANATIRVNGVIVPSGMASNPVTLNATGTTTITTVVTAQDGTTIQQYTIAVSKSSLTNTSLSRIAVTPSATITQIGVTRNFTTSVSPLLTTVQLAATAPDEKEVIKINGAIVNSGSLSNPINLNSSGVTNIVVVVTAPNGTTTGTYNLAVSKNGSSNASLSGVSLTIPATINQVLGTFNFTTSVSPDVTSVEQIAAVVDRNATIKVNGITVQPGAKSFPIPLNPTGTTTINTVVIAEDGRTSLAYALIISKNGSSNTGLAELTFMPGATLKPIPGTTNFTTSVAADVSSVQQTIVSGDKNATIKINGIAVNSGAASNPIPLNATGTTTFTSVITAQDGVSTRTINVTVSKNGSTNTAIRTISITPSATITATSGTNYVTSVLAAVTSVQQTIIPDDPNATITVNGINVPSGAPSAPILLNLTGSTIVITLITAPDGLSTKRYVLTINKNGSTNTAISQIYLSPSTNLTPVAGTENFSASISSAINSVQQTIILADKNASLTVNGVSTASGAASGPVTLNPAGSTLITNMITAQDGFTTKTYTVTITRGSNGDLLSPFIADLVPVTLYTRLTAKTNAGTYDTRIILSSAGSPDAMLELNNCVVKPSPLTITTNSIYKVYGTALVNDNNSNNFQVNNAQLKNNNKIRLVTISYTAGNNAIAPVGKYNNAVKLSNASGDNGFLAGNYAITYKPGHITVTPAPLTVTADNLTKDFGTPNPALTISYLGFVNDEGPGQLTAQPVINTTALIRSPIGQYPIMVYGAISTNYSINYLNGSLTVSGEHLKMFIPNTFTPNGDGINDTWTIGDVDAYPNTTVQVFNRQGQSVFSSLGYGIAWDGTYKGVPLPPGTYYYFIKNTAKVLSGSLTIVR